MPESMFLSAGFSADYYANLKYVVHDGEAHVELNAVYPSAAPFITNKACLAVAGSILDTEATLQRFQLGQVAAAKPYETPSIRTQSIPLQSPSSHPALLPTLIIIQSFPCPHCHAG